MILGINYNAQPAHIPAQIPDAGAPKIDIRINPAPTQDSSSSRQVPIDSKPSLIARIKKSIKTFFKNLSSLFIRLFIRLFIPKKKTTQDSKKDLKQIYTTAESTLKHQVNHFEKRLKNQLKASKIKIEDIKNILEESSNALTNKTNTLTKEKLEQSIKKLKKTYNTVIKVQNQIQTIMNDLESMVSHEEKKITTTLNYKIKQINNIRKKYPQGDLDAAIYCCKEKLYQAHKNTKTQLNKELNDLKIYNADLKNVSDILLYKNHKLSVLKKTNLIDEQTKLILKNQYNIWNRILANTYNKSIIELKKFEEVLKKSQEKLNSIINNIKKVQSEESKKIFIKVIEEDKKTLRNLMINITEIIEQRRESVKHIPMDAEDVLKDMLNPYIITYRTTLKNIVTHTPSFKEHIDSLIEKLEKRPEKMRIQLEKKFEKKRRPEPYQLLFLR